MTQGSYSRVADDQLDELEAGDDVNRYNAVLDVCELIFSLTSEAQSRSSAIQTSDGIRFRIAVPGRHPIKVFWSHAEDGPRIEAVFPHP